MGQFKTNSMVNTIVCIPVPSPSLKIEEKLHQNLK